MSVDVEKALRRGVCATLAEETYLAWIDPDAEPNQAYAPGQVGLYDAIMPSTTESSVTVNTYTVAMWPTPIVGVQFHYASLDLDEMSRAAQAVADVFEGRWGGTLGSIRLVSAAWQSGDALTQQDANGRRGRTDNYYLTISRDTPRR